jgi:hypothetical protein
MGVNYNDILQQWEDDGVPMKRTEIDILRSIERLLTVCEIWLRSILSVLVGLAILISMIAVAHADEAIPAPVVRNAMFVVESLLVKRFPKLEGYAIDVEPPPAFFAELDHRAGEFDGITIKIEDRRPKPCHAVDLTHEVVHHALGVRYGMTPRESEPYARDIDTALTRNPFLPNCTE